MHPIMLLKISISKGLGPVKENGAPRLGHFLVNVDKWGIYEQFFLIRRLRHEH